MIENLRKYTVLIVVLFVLVIIGFVLMDTNTMQKSQGGTPYLKIADRTYSDGDVVKHGAYGFQVSKSLMMPSYYQVDILFVNYLRGLVGNAAFYNSDSVDDETAEKFFTNRILIRAAKEEFGIYPSDNEIESTIRQMRAFTGQDGEFSQEQYSNFINRGLSPLGLREADIRDLASDIIIFNKLNEILGTGLTTDRDMLAKEIAIEEQRINAKIAKIDAAPIKANIKPEESEIKTYWESVQDIFRTDEKRKFAYFIVKSAPAPMPAEIAALAENADDAAKAEHSTKVAERVAAVAEIQRQARLEVGKKVDGFLYKLETQKDLNFKDLAKTDGFELKSTELVAKSGAPEELKATIRSSSNPEGTAADVLFGLTVTSDPLSKITDVAIGENDWLVAYVDEIEASRVKTFDEAKQDATAQLIADKAATALTKAANEANEKIKAALTEGKSFEEAAKSAGIESDILTLTESTQKSQLDPAKYPAGFFDAAKFTAPGVVTEPIIESDRAFIVLVEKREFVIDANTQSMIDGQLSRVNEDTGYAALTSWLNKKTEASNVQRLNRKK